VKKFLRSERKEIEKIKFDCHKAKVREKEDQKVNVKKPKKAKKILKSLLNFSFEFQKIKSFLFQLD
jgi:hypothetical protein